jgi:tetratricopeptide (TPR) repeat protein
MTGLRWGLWLLALVGLGCAAPQATGVGLLQKAVATNDAGYQYYRQGKWDLAEQKFSQALTLNRLIDRQDGIAANLNNLGAIAQEQGDLQRAQECFDEALNILRPLGDPAGICETLNNLGSLYQAQGRLEDAAKAYQEAMYYARQVSPGPLLSLTLTHLGDVARARGDFGQALDLYTRALRLDEARKDRQGRAVRWERLGRTYLAMQDYVTAGTYLQDSLREFRVVEDTNGIVDALDSLTRLALALDQRQEAQDYGQRLLKIYQARGQEKEAEKLQKLLKMGNGAQG